MCKKKIPNDGILRLIPKQKKGIFKLIFSRLFMILVLITVGKILESYSKGKTTNAINSLIKLAPETAVIEDEGKEKMNGVRSFQIIIQNHDEVFRASFLGDYSVAS